MSRLAEWLRKAPSGGWQKLVLVLSLLWVALVALMALASSDPGQNYVALLLIVPIAVLWSLAGCGAWISRAFRPQDASLPSLRKQQPLLWWGSVLIGVAALVGAFALQSGPNGDDGLHQLTRLAASALVVAILSAVVYNGIRPQTSAARARLLLATAFVGAAFVLWQAFDDTQRVSAPSARPVSGPSASAALRGTRTTARSEPTSKPRREAAAPKASAQSTDSTPPAVTGWSDSLSEAVRRHNQDYAALSSRWDADVDALQFESMLTPATLTSLEGRTQNRERLMRFEALLAQYLSQVESLQRDYRTAVLAIDVPAPQRDSFFKEFERAFAASVAQTQKLNADFERVELEIAKTILKITDLMEQEQDFVAVGSDGRTLFFERDAAAQDYNALLKALEKVTAEEDIVTAKSSEAFRKSSDSFNAAVSDLH